VKRCAANVDQIARQLRVLSFEERDLFLAILFALVRKPHIRRCAGGWTCDMGPVHGCTFDTSMAEVRNFIEAQGRKVSDPWTLAVRFARVWYDNMNRGTKARL
jgi:hypothetical protein